MKNLLEGLGFLLLIWMIISAGMMEIFGTKGIFIGALITGGILVAVYIWKNKH